MPSGRRQPQALGVSGDGDGESLAEPTATGGNEQANSVHCCPPPAGVDRVYCKSTLKCMLVGIEFSGGPHQ